MCNVHAWLAHTKTASTPTSCLPLSTNPIWRAVQTHDLIAVAHKYFGAALACDMHSLVRGWGWECTPGRLGVCGKWPLTNLPYEQHLMESNAAACPYSH